MATPLTLCNYFLTEENVKNFSRVSPVNGCIFQKDMLYSDWKSIQSTTPRFTRRTFQWSIQLGSGVRTHTPQNIQVSRGYGDPHGYGYGVDMGIEIPSPRQPWKYPTTIYHYLTIMQNWWSTYDGRLIYRTSYEERKAFLRQDFFCKIARSSEIVFEYPHTIFLREILARSKSLS